MEKTKLEVVKELIENMKKSENPYAQHKADLHKISMSGADIGTACAMLRHELGWEYPEGDKDITAFTEFTTKLQRLSDEDNNFVLDYFNGK